MLPKKLNTRYEGFINPVKHFNTFVEELHENLDDILHHYGVSGINNAKQSEMFPSLEVIENKYGHVLSLETPGMNKNDLSVTVSDDNKLIITGEKKKEWSEEKDKCHVSEISYGKFHREIRIPDNVIEDDISVNYDNGVLKVILPKKKEVKNKKSRKLHIE